MNTLARLFQTWWPWGERRRAPRPNHLCVDCHQDCDCPGLHMLTDCERCSACQPAAERFCPVCGYHCLGRGGRGCIDKPFLTGLDIA